MRRVLILFSALAAMLLTPSTPVLAQDVSLTGLGRFDGWRENSLIGYGLVTGLPGTGDTRRSEVTRRAFAAHCAKPGA